MADHALLSASGSEIWINCPPAARAQEKAAELLDTPTNYRDAGQLGHDIAAGFLRAHVDVADSLPPDYDLATWRSHPLWNANLEEGSLNYVEFVKTEYARALALDPSAQLLIEKRADFSEWVQEGFGTADVTIVFSDTLEVIDLKMGEGKIVQARDNTQGRLYALGRLRHYQEFWGIKKIIIGICQPLRDFNTRETLTVEELLAWARFVLMPAAKLAWAGQGEFKPGQQCQFCRI